MTRTRQVIATLGIACALPTALGAAVALWGGGIRINETTHVLLEVSGSCIAVVVASLLWLRLRADIAARHLLWAAAGLAAMGLLDGVHSALPVGAAWGWSRYVATLCGGLLFAAVWVRPSDAVWAIRRRFVVTIVIATAAVALLLGIGADYYPAPWDAQGYTFWPKIVTVTGGIGFLAAAVFFLRRFRASGERDDLVFGRHTLLFGTSSLLFPFSSVWDAQWWLWHALRLAAYLIVLRAAYVTVRTMNEHLLRRQQELEAQVELRTRDLRASLDAAAHARNHLDDVLMSIRDGMHVVDSHWRLISVNAAGRETLRAQGLDADALLGKNYWEIFPAATRTEVERVIRHVMAERQPAAGETFYEPWQRWYGVRAFPMRDGSLSVFYEDVTARKRTEELLRNSEERFRRIFEHAPTGIAIATWSGQLLQCNPAFAQLVGASEAALHDRPLAEIFHPDDRERGLTQIRRLLSGELGSFEIDARCAHPSGAPVWVHAFVSIMRGRPGVPANLIALLSDITERKQAEDLLRKHAERQQILAEALARLLATDDPVQIARELFVKVASHIGVDAYFNYLVSETGDGLELHSWGGVPDDVMSGMQRLAFGQAICGAVAHRRQPIVATNIQESSDASAAFVRKLGVHAYACHPLVSEGRLLGTLSFARRAKMDFDAADIDFLHVVSGYVAVALDRARAARALRQTEARFSSIFNQTAAGVAQTDLAGRFVLVNERFCQIVGRSREELLCLRFQDITHPADLAENADRFRALANGASGNFVVEKRYLRPDRSVVWVHNDVSVNRDGDGDVRYITAVVADITASKEAQDALRESEERFRQLAENIPQMAWMTHADGWIFWYNKRWFEYTGTTLPQMLGWGWQAVHHPDHLARVREKFKHAIERGEPWEDTFPLRGADGEYRWFLSRAFPIRDSSGTIARWFGTNTDVTDLRHMEEALRSAQEKLVHHAATLERTVEERTARLRETIHELEAFSYSIAHDMRAPLRSMQGFAEILLEEYAPKLDGEARRFLQRISASAERLNELTRDVLSYSRIVRQDLTFEPVDTTRLLDDIIHSYPNLQPDKAEIRIVGELPVLLANRAALTQVFSNLLGNAVKFVAPEVRPRVAIRAEPNHSMVRLWFEDNGIGIDEAGQQRIFAMFQRLNQDPRYEGTGMGLAIVRKAVERMGGRVGVESAPGQGSRFWVELKPAAGA